MAQTGGTNMRNILLRVFPETVGSEYDASKIAYWVFALLSVVSFVRSCIHLFAADGGAGTIASLDLSQGRENIIFSFGLWGLSQLLFALMQLLVAFRYKSLIPLMYVFLVIETLGRMYVGGVKPPIYSRVPPGAVANHVILPLAAVMLALSLLPRKDRTI
jgi:hypothetical protein